MKNCHAILTMHFTEQFDTLLYFPPIFSSVFKNDFSNYEQFELTKNAFRPSEFEKALPTTVFHLFT